MTDDTFAVNNAHDASGGHGAARGRSEREEAESRLAEMARLIWRVMICFAILALWLIGAGCAEKQAVLPKKPDYGRQLAPGEQALVLVPQDQWPDLGQALALHEPATLEALAQSEAWFGRPSTRQFFPIEGVSHEQAQGSVVTLRRILQEATTPSAALAQIRQQFDLYQSVGYDGQGSVLFTGYYTPIFQASKQPIGPYQYPLYTRPADLVSDPNTGKVLGRKTSQGYTAYPTRAELEASGALEGLELVYLKDPFEQYLVQLQGSAKLKLRDGSDMHIGYAGTNGHEYTSVARELVKDGHISADEISLPVVRRFFDQHPEQLAIYTARNDRYVFFQRTEPAAWPLGSLGVPVTANVSLATDKAIFPRGVPTVAATKFTSSTLEPVHQVRLMVDQDTGGAIRAPGRADIYYGIGAMAEALAGRQHAEGQLYYLLLKPEQQVKGH